MCWRFGSTTARAWRRLTEIQLTRTVRNSKLRRLAPNPAGCAAWPLQCLPASVGGSSVPACLRPDSVGFDVQLAGTAAVQGVSLAGLAPIAFLPVPGLPLYDYLLPFELATAQPSKALAFALVVVRQLVYVLASVCWTSDVPQATYNSNFISSLLFTCPRARPWVPSPACAGTGGCAVGTGLCGICKLPGACKDCFLSCTPPEAQRQLR